MRCGAADWQQAGQGSLNPVARDVGELRHDGKAAAIHKGPRKKKERPGEHGTKEVAALTEKRDHVDAAYNKVSEDFQEFVKAHLVEQKAEGEEKKA